MPQPFSSCLQHSLIISPGSGYRVLPLQVPHRLEILSGSLYSSLPQGLVYEFTTYCGLTGRQDWPKQHRLVWPVGRTVKPHASPPRIITLAELVYGGFLEHNSTLGLCKAVQLGQKRLGMPVLPAQGPVSPPRLLEEAESEPQQPPS